MIIAPDRAELTRALDQWRNQGLKIGLVPTMGALHEGHLSLVKLALQHADKCIVTIFVNPTQFAPHEDFDKYPRDEKSDLAKLEQAGVHLVYIPAISEIYPGGPVSDIKAGPAAQELESDIRPHFFDGVLSVVSRLFDHVKPDIAVFGEKDYQQLRVIEEFVTTQKLPIQIIPAPIARDEQGLAFSSRNAYLSAEDLGIARRLNKILSEAKQDDLDKTRQKLLTAEFDEVQYLETRWNRLLAAVKIGKTRLIDNVEAQKSAYEVETGYGPDADARMGILFTITEPGDNKAAKALILAAMQENGKCPQWAVNTLPKGLVNLDGTLPPSFRDAIQAAVETYYLRVEEPTAPTLRPDLAFLKWCLDYE